MILKDNKNQNCHTYLHTCRPYGTNTVLVGWYLIQDHAKIDLWLYFFPPRTFFLCLLKLFSCCCCIFRNTWPIICCAYSLSNHPAATHRLQHSCAAAISFSQVLKHNVFIYLFALLKCSYTFTHIYKYGYISICKYVHAYLVYVGWWNAIVANKIQFFSMKFTIETLSNCLTNTNFYLHFRFSRGSCGSSKQCW